MAAKKGRPGKYTESIAREICERLSQDESLKSICDSPHLPDITTVFRWLREDTHPGFRRQYAQARLAQADLVFDELSELERRVLEGELDASTFRAVMSSRTWRLAKLSPGRYGDRQTLEHTAGIDIAAELNRRIEKMNG